MIERIVKSGENMTGDFKINDEFSFRHANSEVLAVLSPVIQMPEDKPTREFGSGFERQLNCGFGRAC